MKVVVVNGYPGSGKDAFIDLCACFAPVGKCSAIDPAKEALKTLGWDGVEKTSEIRKALSDLKVMSSELFDGPVRYVKQRIKLMESMGKEIGFIIAREPTELQRYREELGALTVFIARDVPKKFSNDADKNVTEFDYDYIIDNHGSLEDLEDAAKVFIGQIREGII